MMTPLGLWIPQWTNIWQDFYPALLLTVGLIGHLLILALSPFFTRVGANNLPAGVGLLEGKALYGVALSGVITCTGGLFEMADLSLIGSQFGASIKFSGVYLMGFAVYIYVSGYIGSLRFLAPLRFWILLGLTFVCIALYWTNPLHQGVVVGVYLDCNRNPTCPLGRQSFGPLYPLLNGYVLCLALYGVGQLWLLSGQLSKLYRPQVWCISLALMSPALTSLAWGFGAPAWGNQDLGIFGIGLASWFLLAGVVCFRLLSAPPTAWIQSVGARRDAVYSLRPDLRVVEANKAAQAIRAVELGQLINDIFPQFSLESGGTWTVAQQHFEVQVLPLGPLSQPIGYALTLYDVTSLRQVQHTLEDANAQLQGQNLALSRSQAALQYASERLEQQNQTLAQQSEALKATQRALEATNDLLHQRSITDSLTGLYNRRRLDEQLERELKVLKAEQDLCLIVLDIDHFREFNSKYGHRGGDQVLQKLGQYLRTQATFHAQSSSYRYGGEEFCLLLPDTTLEQARDLAEMLRQGLRNLPLILEGRSAQVTVSLAVASVRHHGSDVLKIAADNALSLAKQGGRDRVEVASRTPSSWGRGWW